MAHTPTDLEARIRRLEGLMQHLQRMLRNALEMARRALEMAGLGGGGNFGGGGVETYHYCLVTTDIPAPANSTANATFGYVRIRQMNPDTGAFVNHPAFPDPVKTWNGWPGTATTATAGKVVTITYEDQAFKLSVESC